MEKKRAIIIGGGPAGLTVAHELLTRTDIQPIIFERDPEYVGGISRTVTYDGNRIDIGGHRFFSKSERVMKWWADMLPVQMPEEGANITYRNAVEALAEGLTRAGPDAGTKVMLLRPRLSRIIYKGQFFPYPIELSFSVLRKLGFMKVVRILVTYLQAVVFPRRPEVTLEDFFINRFGKELYETFFKSYTEKVWGVPCTELSAEWGAQRVKGLSILKAGLHMVSKMVGSIQSTKQVETSLIEQFLYPAYGPGFMWETVAKKVKEKGGEIHMGVDVTGLTTANGKIVSATIRRADGQIETVEGDYFFSTTDMRSLVRGIPDAPEEIRSITEGLEYRDFLTVGLLLDAPPTDVSGEVIHDTWMYVHEPNVTAGRVQFFHNWSPYLVSDAKHGHIGLEYFCKEGDSIWSMSDEELRVLGEKELELLGLMGSARVIDGIIVRQPKAYPGYFGTYEQLPKVREYLDTFENLYLLGRNGMHRYNNQDHSMLTAMIAVDTIVEGKTDKKAIWGVNTEQEYHEEKR